MSDSEISGIPESDNSTHGGANTAMMIHREVAAALATLLPTMLSKYLKENENKREDKIGPSSTSATLLGRGGFGTVEAVVNDKGFDRRGKR